MGSPGRSLLSIWRSGRAEIIQGETPTGGDVKRTSRAGPADGDAGETPVGFAALNAGKRSLAVHIRTCEGAHAVGPLGGSAEVFIDNCRPGGGAQYGLGYAAICAIRPDIVYCSISGYGQEGACPVTAPTTMWCRPSPV